MRAGGPGLADTTVVPVDAADVDLGTCAAFLQKEIDASAQPTRGGSPADSTETPSSTSLQDLRTTLNCSGLTSCAVDLVMNSWRPTIQISYDTFIRKWQFYVARKKIRNPAHEHVASFSRQVPVIVQ